MQMSLDGFIEGPKGDPHEILFTSDDQWDDIFEFLESVDTFLLGRVMYPEYEQYWGSVLTNPSAPANEIKYAQLAARSPHIVFSRTMTKANWKNTRIVHDHIKEEIIRLKQMPGKNIQIVGGAILASSMINFGLVDEYRILVNPIIIGDGKSLFRDLAESHKLNLVRITRFSTGVVAMYYQDATAK